MKGKVNPIAALEIVMEGCGAYPDQLLAMKALLKMIRDENEVLQEGAQGMNPFATLARESDLLGQIEDLNELLKAFQSKPAGRL